MSGCRSVSSRSADSASVASPRTSTPATEDKRARTRERMTSESSTSNTRPVMRGTHLLCPGCPKPAATVLSWDVSVPRMVTRRRRVRFEGHGGLLATGATPPTTASFDQVVLHGVPNEVSGRLELELLEHTLPIGADGLGAQG